MSLDGRYTPDEFAKQEEHLSNDIMNLLMRYAEEYQMTTCQMIGVLFIITDQMKEFMKDLNGEDDDDGDGDGDGDGDDDDSEGWKTAN